MKKGEILNLAKTLISIESTKDKPQNLSKVLSVAQKQLSAYTVQKYSKNNINSLLAYNTKGLPKNFKIILNAHLDTVPGKSEQFKPKVKGDKLFGRGAIDMKSAAAAMILVFKEVANAVSYPLGLQIVTDEEVGGFNGTKYQIEKGIRSDFVIAGENTNFGVNNKAKGILWIKVTTKGSTAHSAYLWQGKNAIEKMNRVLTKLYKVYPQPNHEVWKTTMNVAKIETTNSIFNKVSEDCSVSIDLRYIPKDENTLIDKIRNILPDGVELEIVEFEPPQITNQKNPYLKKLRASTKEITGKPAPIIVKHGGSDLRHYSGKSIDGVTFGPIGKGLHTDNEWVDIKSLGEYYQILENFLLSVNKH